MQTNSLFTVYVLMLAFGIPIIITSVSFIILKSLKKAKSESNKVILKLSSIIPPVITAWVAFYNIRPHDNGLSIIYGFFAFVQSLFCLGTFLNRYN